MLFYGSLLFLFLLCSFFFYYSLSFSFLVLWIGLGTLNIPLAKVGVSLTFVLSGQVFPIIGLQFHTSSMEQVDYPNTRTLPNHVHFLY